MDLTLLRSACLLQELKAMFQLNQVTFKALYIYLSLLLLFQSVTDKETYFLFLSSTNTMKLDEAKSKNSLHLLVFV